VERFVPETVEDGYAVRYWVFLGDRESCLRHVSRSAIVKGLNTIRVERVEAPAALREKRAALGFDYGKLDFVEHDGEVVLLDANRTPGAPGPELGPAEVNEFAHGLHALISGAA